MLFSLVVDSLGEAIPGSFEPFFLDCVKVAKALVMAEEASAASELYYKERNLC